jgi:Kef-type K+ transport system membrane component KefB
MAGKLPTPYDMLDDAGQRVAKRGAIAILACMIAGILSYIGLLIYMVAAQNFHWMVFHIWFAATSAAVTLGIIFINRRLVALVARQRPGELTNLPEE